MFNQRLSPRQFFFPDRIDFKTRIMSQTHSPETRSFNSHHQAKIQFPSMEENDSTTFPLYNPPPFESLPTPPRRTQSHAPPRISPSPQARNAIYFNTSKSTPSQSRQGTVPVTDTTKSVHPFSVYILVLQQLLTINDVLLFLLPSHQMSNVLKVLPLPALPKLAPRSDPSPPHFDHHHQHQY